MAKPIITINEWTKGMGKSAYVGFERLQGLNISDKPGAIFPNYAMQAENTITIAGAPKWKASNYISTATGRLYKYSGGATPWADCTSNSDKGAYGLVSWEGYVFQFTQTGWNIYTGSAYVSTGTLKDQAFASAPSHPAFVGSDGCLYIASNNIISKLEKVGTFSPTDSATYTFTATALDLPKSVVVTTIEELAGYLMIGTYNSTDYTSAEIYRWNKSIAESFNYPIKIDNVRGINQMKVVNNTLYIQAGNQGQIFACNGATISEINRIPRTVISDSNSNFYAAGSPHSIDAFKGKLLIGATVGGGSVSLAAVFALDLASGALTIENTPTNADATSIGILQTMNDTNSYRLGWTDATNNGIDALFNYSPSYTPITGYNAYLISPFYFIGRPTAKTTLSAFEMQFGKAIPDNASIRLYYRLVQGGSWTQIADVTTDGISSWEGNCLVPTTDKVQFKVAFSGNEGIELNYINFYG